MTFRVVVQQVALEDLDDCFRWAARNAPETAARWLNRFQAELQSLEANPQRCSVAPESKKVRREIRQLLFGKRPNVYRAIFTIDGDVVRVLRIRRASRRGFKPHELGD